MALGLPNENKHADTDADSEASDLEAEGDPSHMPYRILASTSQVTWTRDDSEEFDSDDDIPLSEVAKTLPPKKRKKMERRPKTWKAADPSFKIQKFQPADGPDAFQLVQQNAKVHFDLFKLFWSEEFVNLMVVETNRYAQQKGNHVLNVTSDEIYVFLGIMLLTGYHKLHSKRAYWSVEPDVHTPIVANAMRRARFEEIMRYLHFSDNSLLDGTDSMAKIRPIMKQMNNASKILPPGEKLSIDESMIKYYGHHGAKQFIRGKPIRFGYKLWVCADPSGYVHHAEVYCGSSTEIQDRGFGQGGNVVLELLEKTQALPGTTVYFDNLFTSVELLEELGKLQIGGTGTLRANRVKKEMNMPDKKKFAKTERGKYFSRTCDEIEATMWNDNSVVTVLSNVDGCMPTKTAQRFSRKEKKKIDIQMPSCIYEYNRSMGGVDLSDQFANAYRTIVRSKKWWWPFFAWSVNMSTVQCWLLGRKIYDTVPSFPKMLHLIEVRRSLALHLLLTYGQAPLAPGPGPTASSAILRVTQGQHCIRKGDKKAARCKLCKKRTSYMCHTCEVYLHPDCFFNYHA